LKTFRIDSLEETENVAEVIADQVIAGNNYALLGDLGSGKTTLIKLICKHLEITEIVNSPTFTIVNEYKNKNWKINHIDFYRINHIDELLEIGIDNYFGKDCVTFVEWANLFPEILPESIQNIYLENKPTGRTLSI
jgi:tRNA threonylcarbamoyladenosine biosynthesis protein TsaE